MDPGSPTFEIGLQRIDSPFKPGAGHQLLEQVLDVLKEKQVSADSPQHLIDLGWSARFRAAGLLGHLGSLSPWARSSYQRKVVELGVLAGPDAFRQPELPVPQLGQATVQ